MIKRLVFFSLVSLIAGWIFLPGAGDTTVEMAVKEGNLPCAKCHVKTPKNRFGLNELGKCYKEKNDLKACLGMEKTEPNR